jgi:hypothetical protein
MVYFFIHGDICMLLNHGLWFQTYKMFSSKKGGRLYQANRLFFIYITAVLRCDADLLKKGIVTFYGGCVII